MLGIWEFYRVNGKIIKEMEMENLLALMEISMMEIGKIIKGKDLVTENMKMEINIMVVFLMEKKLYLEL